MKPKIIITWEESICRTCKFDGICLDSHLPILDCRYHVNKPGTKLFKRRIKDAS